MAGSENGSRAIRPPAGAVTGLVPDWLERQHAVTRPDRVMTITEYDERITSALGMLPGTLYLVCRRLLLDTCGQPTEGIADSLVISTRELADRVGLAGHAQVVRFLNQQQWFLRRAAAAQVIRQANGEVIGRTPTRWQVFGLPPLLPADQQSIHTYIRKRVKPGNADDALAAVQALNALAGQGWAALTANLFTAPASLDDTGRPAAHQPQSLVSLVQDAAGLSLNRTPMALVQATQTLRANLRGRRTEIPHYLIDHWLPELGPTKFWLLLQVLRECQDKGQENATLYLAASAGRIGISERTLRRLAHDLNGLLDSLGAFAGVIGLVGNRLEFGRVLYSPEAIPLAPVHERSVLSSGEQNSPSVKGSVRQNSPSVAVRYGQNSPSAVVTHGQISPSTAARADNAHHRPVAVPGGESVHRNGRSGAVADKTHLEEKSLIEDSPREVGLDWGLFWNAMKSHSKLQRSRRVRERAGQHVALWAAVVLEQMTRGMEDPTTLAVDSFDPMTSPRTVPYICLELANRGPEFTARVLAAINNPEIDWPSDPDIERCISELRRIGTRVFKESPSTFAGGTLGQLGLLQLADQLRAQARRDEAATQPDWLDDTAEEVQEADSPSGVDLLWQTALEHLRMELPPGPFDTWLRHTRLLGVVNDHYTIAAPTQYAADVVQNRFARAIVRVLALISGTDTCTVEFQVGQGASAPQAESDTSSVGLGYKVRRNRTQGPPRGGRG